MTAVRSVPTRVARGTVRSGSRMLPAAIVAHSSPVNAQRVKVAVDVTAFARLPTFVSAIAKCAGWRAKRPATPITTQGIKLTPPNGARDAGNRKTPDPIMLPMTSATAIQNPIWAERGEDGTVVDIAGDASARNVRCEAIKCSRDRTESVLTEAAEFCCARGGGL